MLGAKLYLEYLISSHRYQVTQRSLEMAQVNTKLLTVISLKLLPFLPYSLPNYEHMKGSIPNHDPLFC